IVQEFKKMFVLISNTLNAFKIIINYVSLSLRDRADKEKYYANDQMWDEAEIELKKIIKELGIKYEEKNGEAVFYGPKVDIQILTALNHKVTVTTIQIDFL
ncbi:threonine--tRNA ligase, partial [Mycoplasmopsis synoviae]